MGQLTASLAAAALLGPNVSRPTVTTFTSLRRLVFLAASALACAVPALAAEMPDAVQAPVAVAAEPVVPLIKEGPGPKKVPQDHSHYKELQGPFTSPEQVTQACLSCHTKAGHQVMSSIHWTWKAWNPVTKQMVGKNHVYNTFCVSPISNEQFCTVCHTGYGSMDPDKWIPFEKRSQDHVDCLVCHDQTKTYRKIPFIGGNPAMEKIAVRPGCNEVYGTDKPYVLPEDLSNIAKHVSAPTRYTCGICHFYGGGGDGVKHGDLDSSLNNPPHDLDVHMDSKGLNFPCQKCHQSSNHDIAGSHYAIAAAPKEGAYMTGSKHNGSRATCQSCHGQTPHKVDGDEGFLRSTVLSATLNRHTKKVACQTCHIPEFARGGLPTKMDWNYATAGKLSVNGSPLVMVNQKGWDTYWGVKGSFQWGENVVPTYRWFNGNETWLSIGQKVDPDKNGVIHVNDVMGSAEDGHSKIWPFKISRNNQPYDPDNHVLTVFHSFGFDDNAFTMTYDWQRSIVTGMKEAKLPYSGHFDFVKTAMYWPITHMVAPKEKALSCGQCHSDNSRLAGISGVYMPARDHHRILDLIGGWLAALTLVGTIIHCALRCFLRRKEK